MEQLAPIAGLMLLLLGAAQYVQNLIKKNEAQVDKTQLIENALQVKINDLYEKNVELRLTNQALEQQLTFYKNQYKIYKSAYTGFLAGFSAAQRAKADVEGDVPVSEISVGVVTTEIAFDTKPLPPLPNTLTDLNEP